MTLFYSITFSDFPIPHHSEVEYPINAFQNYDKYTDSMKAFCDASLKKSLKRWGFSSTDIISVDYYFYRGAEEVIFFSWEKETKTETEKETTNEKS